MYTMNNLFVYIMQDKVIKLNLKLFTLLFKTHLNISTIVGKYCTGQILETRKHDLGRLSSNERSHCFSLIHQVGSNLIICIFRHNSSPSYFRFSLEAQKYVTSNNKT